MSLHKKLSIMLGICAVVMIIAVVSISKEMGKIAGAYCVVEPESTACKMNDVLEASE